MANWGTTNDGRCARRAIMLRPGGTLHFMRLPLNIGTNSKSRFNQLQAKFDRIGQQMT